MTVPEMTNGARQTEKLRKLTSPERNTRHLAEVSNNAASPHVSSEEGSIRG